MLLIATLTWAEGKRGLLAAGTWGRTMPGTPGTTPGITGLGTTVAEAAVVAGVETLKMTQNMVEIASKN